MFPLTSSFSHHNVALEWGIGRMESLQQSGKPVSEGLDLCECELLAALTPTSCQDRWVRQQRATSSHHQRLLGRSEEKKKVREHNIAHAQHNKVPAETTQRLKMSRLSADRPRGENGPEGSKGPSRGTGPCLMATWAHAQRLVHLCSYISLRLNLFELY